MEIQNARAVRSSGEGEAQLPRERRQIGALRGKARQDPRRILSDPTIGPLFGQPIQRASEGGLGIDHQNLARHRPASFLSSLPHSTAALPPTTIASLMTDTASAAVANEQIPDARGRFGTYGGRFVPETLMHPLQQLEEEYFRARKDPAFQQELDYYLREFCGRQIGRAHV